MILVGSTALQRQDRSAILTSVHKLAAKLRPAVDKDWKIVNILHRVRYINAVININGFSIVAI